MNQQTVRQWLLGGGVVAGLGGAVCCTGGCGGVPFADGRLVVWWTADIAVAGWTLGAAMQLRTRPAEWAAGGPRRVLGQFAWGCGWVFLAAHLLAAFDRVHRWSHAAAVADTERQSGVGEGVFVNYAVLAVWAADAVWYAAAAASYGRRPRWVGWAVHGFLAFVTFNAAVVYTDPLVRPFGAIWFAILAALWATRPRER